MMTLTPLIRPKTLTLFLALALGCFQGAYGFNVYQQVDGSTDPLLKPDNTPLVAGEFTLKVGYFNYDASFATNNAQIIANATSTASLSANFVTLFEVDGTEGNNDTFGFNAAVGDDVGGPGLVLAYLKQTDVVWTGSYSSFSGKNIYAWFQLKSNPLSQAIFAEPNATFAGATNAFTDAIGNLALLKSNSNLLVLVGGTTGSGFQLMQSATSSSFAFTSGTASVQENAGTAGLTVTRSGKLDTTVSVAFSTTSASAVSPTDFAATSGTLTFAPNVTSQPIAVPIVDRAGFQGDRSFAVDLALTGSATELGTPSTVAVTILDNELPQRGVLSFTSGTYSVSESGTSLDVVVQRLSGSDGPVGVTFSTENISATSGTDYTGVASQALSWNGGDATSRTITIPITDDMTFEGDETFRALLATPTGGATIGTGTSTVTIIEDDPLPKEGTISLSSDAYSVSESGTVVTITVNRSNGSGGLVTVAFSTMDGTATSGGSYTMTSGTLSWGDGVEGGQSFTVPILDNPNDETDKTFTVMLSTPTGGASLVAPSEATVTINDDDTAGALGFDPTSYSVDETGGSVNLLITRNGGSDGAVSVLVNTGGGTAASGDYGSLVNTPVNFANGQTSGTLTVAINDNGSFTGDRNFNVTLSNPTNGATLGADVAEVTILEDETPNYGVFAFSAAKFTASETGPEAIVTVSRTGGSDASVTLNFQTVDGTAAAPGDYTATSGTITFAQGETSKDLTIPLIDDADPEKKESFTVNLAIDGSSPGGTLGGITTTSVEINDNDAPATIQFAASTITGTEGQTFSLSVVRSNLLERPASVRWTLNNGSAVAGKDYRGPQTGTLKFEAGETQKTIEVRTIDDVTPEEQEVFTAVLSKVDPKNPKVKIGTPSTMKIKIAKNDNIEQPDVSAAVRGGAYVGEKVFNSNGTGQIAIQTVNTGDTARFNIKVENGGNLKDSFTVTALEGGLATGTKITYSANGIDITRKLVEQGGIKFRDLAPGEKRTIEVTIKAEGAVLGGYGTTITATSQTTPAKVDAARALVVISEL